MYSTPGEIRHLELGPRSARSTPTVPVRSTVQWPQRWHGQRDSTPSPRCPGWVRVHQAEAESWFWTDAPFTRSPGGLSWPPDEAPPPGRRAETVVAPVAGHLLLTVTDPVTAWLMTPDAPDLNEWFDSQVTLRFPRRSLRRGGPRGRLRAHGRSLYRRASENSSQQRANRTRTAPARVAGLCGSGECDQPSNSNV